jgi:hypothetical protein
MKNFAKLVVLIPASLLIGILIGWLLFGPRHRSGVVNDKELLLQIINQHNKDKSALTRVDEETRSLYRRINKTLQHCTKASCNDSIVDLLRYTSAVINHCADVNSRVMEMYELDSIVMEQSKRAE